MGNRVRSGYEAGVVVPSAGAGSKSVLGAVRPAVFGGGECRRPGGTVLMRSSVGGTRITGHVRMRTLEADEGCGAGKDLPLDRSVARASGVAHEPSTREIKFTFKDKGVEEDGAGGGRGATIPCGGAGLARVDFFESRKAPTDAPGIGIPSMFPSAKVAPAQTGAADVPLSAKGEMAGRVGAAGRRGDQTGIFYDDRGVGDVCREADGRMASGLAGYERAGMGDVVQNFDRVGADAMFERAFPNRALSHPGVPDRNLFALDSRC